MGIESCGLVVEKAPRLTLGLSIQSRLNRKDSACFFHRLEGVEHRFISTYCSCTRWEGRQLVPCGSKSHTGWPSRETARPSRARRHSHLVTGPPFGLLSVCAAACNAAANAADPFSAQPDLSRAPFLCSTRPRRTLSLRRRRTTGPLLLSHTASVCGRNSPGISYGKFLCRLACTHLIRTPGLNQAGLATSTIPSNSITTTGATRNSAVHLGSHD
jgi:hypothetical protein